MTEQELQYLIEIFDNQEILLTTHELLKDDDEYPAISIFRIENGNCIGGITKSKYRYLNEFETLFNLTTKKCFKYELDLSSNNEE